MTPELVYQAVIYGVAQPAGSKRSFVPLHPKTKQPYRDKFGRIVVNTVDANENSPAWKRHVALQVKKSWFQDPLDCPLFLQAVFYRERPDRHFGTGKNYHILKAGAEAFPISKPDVLKLMRGVEDALTGILYVDDSRIVDEHISKRWGEPRVAIALYKLPETVAELKAGEELGGLFDEAS